MEHEGDEEEQIELEEVHSSFGFELDVAVQIALHKQADVPTMVGVLSPKWGDPQTVAVMLSECVEKDILDFNMDRERFIVKYPLTPEMEKEINQKQFPLPMVVEPLPIEDNFHGTGYYDRKGSVVLNSWANHEDGTSGNVFIDEDVCLDHLNRMNSVKLSLNMDVIASRQGEIIKPQRKPGEDHEKFAKRLKQHRIFYKNSLEVMESVFILGNEFWLTHAYDRRGRCYARGYHINSQGTDYNKAVLEFANKEIIE